MSSIEKNKVFLSDLFAGPFRGHGIIMDPETSGWHWSVGDVAVSDKPVEWFVDKIARVYEDFVKYHQAIGDDSVPFARLSTGTEIFAAAFGCQVHLYDENPPAAMPLVTTAEEADKLDIPSLSAVPFDRIFEAGRMLQEKLGNDVIIGVPDIQSPFDIAALIWRKEDLMVALYESPDAVQRLTAKCTKLLKEFLNQFISEFPNCNLCHCPTAWAPVEMGCWLSEDEAGALSTSMFEEFCLPSLVELSNDFGGMFMHCCATADHQYANFNKIPNLRGINRVFQEPGPKPAIEAFEGQTVLMMAWMPEEHVNALLDMALPGTRFLFNLPALPLDEAKATYERLRERCARDAETR